MPIRQIPDLMASLAAVSQGNLGQIRKTLENPPRISVYDTITALTGVRNPRDSWADLQMSFPEVVGKTDYFKFPGQGQRQWSSQGLAVEISKMPLTPLTFHVFLVFS